LLQIKESGPVASAPSIAAGCDLSACRQRRAAQPGARRGGAAARRRAAVRAIALQTRTVVEAAACASRPRAGGGRAPPGPARPLLGAFCMTHRIELDGADGATRISFQGLLDRAALADVLSCVRDARRAGVSRVVLTLGVGTEVDGECIEKLLLVEGLIVKAVSPFLTRWLRQRGIE
jgi:hypothetical protein